MAEPRREKVQGQENIDIPDSWSAQRRRQVLAVLAFGVLAALAFFYLHSGRIEGGAFVSLLTLAFGVGLITLIWHRITHITILGSEIKLQRLTKEAETLVGELDSGKADLYRTALGVMKHSAQVQGDEGRVLGERSAALVELLDNLEKAQLLQVLDEEALSTTDRVIDELARNVSHQVDFPADLHSKSPSLRAEAMIKRFDEERSMNEPQGIRGTNDADPSSELVRTVDDLKILLRYRRRIQGQTH